jgi:putative phosphoesterase
LIATLSDIHGNLTALDAVLAEVPETALIVVCGDIAAGGPYPSETLERLRALGDRVRWVRGNADRALAPTENQALCAPEAMADARARLTEEQVAFLHGLPLTCEIDGVVYCHASPQNDLDIFTERTPDDRLARLFAGLDAHTIVCGHTHLHFVRGVGGRGVINAGSVGASAETDPGAYWLLDMEPRRTSYAGALKPHMSREAWLARLETLGYSL